MNSRRRLTDEEQALWHGVARSVRPLRKKSGKSVPPAVVEPKPEVQSPKPQPRAATKPAAAAAASAPLAPLDRRLRQKIASGRQSIDDRLDLHGLTQSEAHRALLHFISRAQANEYRLVLVVTGKGSVAAKDGRPSERGVLRRQVPLWLSLPEFRPFVGGFDEAHIGHGGGGALYVRIRRRR